MRVHDVIERVRSEQHQAADLPHIRTRIVDEALTLARQRGDHRLFTMRMLASRLSMSPTALYQQFAGKKEIEAAIRERVLTQLGSELLECRQEPDPAAAISSWLDRFLTRACEDPVTRACVMDVGDDESFDPPQVMGAASLETVLERAHVAGQIRNDLDPKLALRLVWTFATGLLRLSPRRSNGADVTDADRGAIDRSIRAFINGLVAPQWHVTVPTATEAMWERPTTS